VNPILSEALIITICVTAVFYALLLVCSLVLLKVPRLLPTHEPTNDFHSVTVVIAARDEAEGLPGCLESLVLQQGVEKIILVDDQSRDDTLRVAKDFSSKYNKVLVLSAPPLPERWMGKSHALQFGAKEAISPYILFTDADVILSQGVIQEAAQIMTLEKLDHLSSHFFVDCRTIAEEICAPVLVLFSSLALFSTAKLVGAATGAFNMVRAEKYRLWQGHEPIKDKIVDDVALARHLMDCGARSRFLHSDDRIRVRLFIGFDGFMKAVARSSVPFLNLGTLAISLLATCVAIMVFTTLGCLFIPLFALHYATDQLSSFTLWLSPVPYLLGLLSLCIGRRFDNGRLIFRIFYPFAIIILAFGVFRASVCRLRKAPVEWRGRQYEHGV
jgi:hypothetical protein